MSTSPTPIPNAVEAHISLRGMDVARTVVLPANDSLRELHHAIQGTFGWWDYHLHRFGLHSDSGFHEYEDATLPDFDPTLNFDESLLTLRMAESRINNTAYDVLMKMTPRVNPRGPRPSLHYVYDFGDNWTCDITLTSRMADTSEMYTCIHAQGAAPCEDAGGPDAYLDKVKQYDAGDRDTRRWFRIMRHKPYAEVTPAKATRAWRRFLRGDVPGPDESVPLPMG